MVAICVVFENEDGLRVGVVVTIDVVEQINVEVYKVVHDSRVAPVDDIIGDVMAAVSDTLANSIL